MIIVDRVVSSEHSFSSRILSEEECGKIKTWLLSAESNSEKVQYALNIYYDKGLKFVSRESDESLMSMFSSAHEWIGFLIFEEI